VLGVASSGLHSNGYSLVRKVVFDIAKLDVATHVPELGQTVGEALLTPTRIYARPMRRVFRHYQRSIVHGVAHITGGGLFENLERILPDGVQAVIARESWPRPAVFNWLAKLGDIEPAEMDRVFNMGIGLALVFNPYYLGNIQRMLSECGLESWPIGEIRTGTKGVGWK
jgi:phosphoribosylformylglycinamidine cyclo-ligase